MRGSSMARPPRSTFRSETLFPSASERSRAPLSQESFTVKASASHKSTLGTDGFTSTRTSEHANGSRTGSRSHGGTARTTRTRTTPRAARVYHQLRQYSRTHGKGTSGTAKGSANDPVQGRAAHSAFIHR